MLKTKSSGQISFFTIKPGMTRENTITTPKLKISDFEGEGLFRFRNILTDDFFEITVSGNSATIVDTVPGWAHDVTNVGGENLICMLWASENFDKDSPDTFSSPVVLDT